MTGHRCKAADRSSQLLQPLLQQIHHINQQQQQEQQQNPQDQWALGDIFGCPVNPRVLRIEAIAMDGSCCCWPLALACSLVLAAAWALSHWRRYAGTPPGPTGLPLVGYWPFVTRDLHKDYNRLAGKYGDVFSLVLGWRYVIVLNTYDVIKEAFVKDGDIYAGKPKNGIEPYFGEYKSVFMTDGPEWREQRRFIMSTFRDFGFGKNKLEQFVRNEARMTCQEISRWGHDHVHNIRRVLLHATANAVSSLIFDKSFPYDQSSLTDLLALFEIDPAHFSQLNPIDLYPVLEYLPGKWTGFAELDRLKKIFYDFVDKLVEEHEASFDETNIRDLVDVYLMKFRQLERDPKLRDDPQNAVYTRAHMRSNITILFSAGVDTTATTTAWALKLLAAHPHVQERLQAQVDDVVGREREPATADRSRMPYAEATVLEAMRYVSLVTTTFWHRITDDTTLRGYRIPKDAFVVAHLWNVHHDPATWGDPMVFRPERFLGPDGKINHLRELVIPFSIGKRNCLGESLARMEVFIYLTSLMQKFTFYPPPGKPFSVDPDYFLPIAFLKCYDICAKPRT